MRVPWGGVVPLGGEPTVNTTGAGLLAPPARAPGCRVPPKPAEGAEEQGRLRDGLGLDPPQALWQSSHLPISIGFSCRLSVLPESEACVPNAALSSRSVRRLVLKDLRWQQWGGSNVGGRPLGSAPGALFLHTTILQASPLTHFIFQTRKTDWTASAHHKFPTSATLGSSSTR